MIVVLKTFAGQKFEVGRKEVVLIGNGYLNEVDNDTWSKMKERFPSINQMIKDDFIVESGVSDNKAKNEVKEEAKKDAKNKQKKDQSSNTGLDKEDK